MVDIRIVQTGYALLWPADVFPKARRHRGGAGYVVDLDAPLEREWCAGQERKLVTPERALAQGIIKEGDEIEPNEIEEPIAIRALVDAGHHPRSKPRDLETRLEANAASGVREKATGLALEELNRPQRSDAGRRSARRVSVRMTKEGPVIIQHPRKRAEPQEVRHEAEEETTDEIHVEPKKPARKKATRKKAQTKPAAAAQPDEVSA